VSATSDTPTVPGRADIAVHLPRAAVRRLRLHHTLVRRRRFSRELVRLLSPPPDPWELSEPIVWDQLALGVPEREYRGEELRARRWRP
jgi:hypothetical protein